MTDAHLFTHMDTAMSLIGYVAMIAVVLLLAIDFLPRPSGKRSRRQ